MSRKYGIWMFVAAVVLLPLGLFAMVKWYELRFTRLPFLGPEKHTVKDFSLLSHMGGIASAEKWKGKIVVANLFFTQCPVVCPKMTRNLKKVQQLYGGDGKVLINSFTVDPERDSVASLRNYASRMDIRKNWQLITGPKKEIYRFARKSLLVVATDGDGGPNDFIHSELLILVDSEKRIRGFYNGTVNEEVDHLLRDIKRLKAESR